MQHLIQVGLCRDTPIRSIFLTLDVDSQQSDSDKDDEEEEFEAYLMEDESDDEGLKKEGSSKKQHKKPV